MGPELVSRHPEVASRQWRSMFLKYLRSLLLNLGTEPSCWRENLRLTMNQWIGDTWRPCFKLGGTGLQLSRNAVWALVQHPLGRLHHQCLRMEESSPIWILLDSRGMTQIGDAGFLCGCWFPQWQKLLQSVWSKHLRTPLHYACAYGNPAVVALLVKRKCSIDLCDSDGNTPLMKALQYEEEECAIILLEHGANPNVHNNKGETPLHYVILYRNTLIATKLLSSNADIEAKNMLSADTTSLYVVLMIEPGPHACLSGQTPLLLTIKKNRQMMVEFFIKNKANIHAVDDNGRNLILQYMKAQSRTSVNFNPDLSKNHTQVIPCLQCLGAAMKLILRTSQKKEENLLKLPDNP
ncbi:putative ankyrin repeat domain-containing protein 30B-like isoform X3 [Marmota monax]|uniref:putative ankyrin repeat domain-containing protein 30B-like isoform X3 n=1 Tax=Marmota monax TaxID=9995 RepID=UPI0026EA163E|nr:putative ankyrin repeat domain-containing protein 30B-like isoform X3 [Marmota monax]